jgi:hypothetical protein
MTEVEWNACTDPESMVGCLKSAGEPSRRKCHLYAGACVRRIWHLLPDQGCREAVETAERYVDGVVGLEELASALAAMNRSRRLRGAANQARQSCWLATFEGAAAHRLDWHYGRVGPYGLLWASLAAGHARDAAAYAASRQAQRAGRPGRQPMRAAGDAESRAQADLVRDIVPNPFRPPPPIPLLLGTVVSLAHAAYDERELPSGHLDGTRLAVLSDSLEEARAAAELVEHLRGPGPHVRGCWVVDLLTSRE